MTQLFDIPITLLNRDYQPMESELATVIIGDLEVTVPDHEFWKKFASGWEPDTERIYQSSLSQKSTVLDIGAWIGPTILFSLAYGAENIIALEPNPESFSSLQKILMLNPRLNEKVVLLNQAVSNTPGILKMGLVEGESDTSTFGIQGDEIEIETTTITDLIHKYDLNKIDLIKIDIEGSEVLLKDELERLSQIKGQRIHLSIHVPFFPESVDRRSLASALKNFEIYDDRGDQLSFETFKSRLLTDQTHPTWGTKHGNFFEVLLISNPF